MESSPGSDPTLKDSSHAPVEPGNVTYPDPVSGKYPDGSDSVKFGGGGSGDDGGGFLDMLGDLFS
ncbi:hypothetical protein DP939_26345 [Spongiactinospora rosea]|uniref:Uncharacterized protein n=1 Tax=Spongiactinospora rosea TaxID=2248750 RepID=A0A366LST6_9ACTN|nr:hypothetical protein DP939_26345 [Spongiactinospora rosea]